MEQKSIGRLIINSPYEEPAQHWSYNRERRTFSLVEGRRPAGYVVASEGSRAFDDPGHFVEIPNKLDSLAREGMDSGGQRAWADSDAGPVTCQGHQATSWIFSRGTLTKNSDKPGAYTNSPDSEIGTK